MTKKITVTLEQIAHRKKILKARPVFQSDLAAPAALPLAEGVFKLPPPQHQLPEAPALKNFPKKMPPRPKPTQQQLQFDLKDDSFLQNVLQDKSSGFVSLSQQTGEEVKTIFKEDMAEDRKVVQTLKSLSKYNMLSAGARRQIQFKSKK